MATSKWQFPAAMERGYARDTVSAVSEFCDSINLIVGKLDADADEIEQADESISDMISAALAALVVSLPRIAASIYKVNVTNFVRSAESGGGKENALYALYKMYGDQYKPDWYDQLYGLWEQETKTSMRKLLAAIKDDVMTRVQVNNLASKSVGGIVRERRSVYASWGKNRARIAIGRFAALSTQRMLKQAGIIVFRWRGMLDEREREKHLLWEKVYQLVDSDDYPFPGTEPMCRCWPEIVWQPTEEIIKKAR